MNRAWPRVIVALLVSCSAVLTLKPASLAREAPTRFYRRTGGGTPAIAPPGATPEALLPDAQRIAESPRALVALLRDDSFAYFRFVNQPWTRRVCELFQSDLPGLASVRLHGDAHLEQYAVTADSRGLDDFDDSAKGPSIIDSVRFLGSLMLAAQSRQWSADLDGVFDEFFAGYRKGVADPGYMPPEPEVVGRLRAAYRYNRGTFLARAESLMQPMTPGERVIAIKRLTSFARLFRHERPELPVGYFVPRKVGWLRMGIGSALARKMLFRVQGPSRAPTDDVILEAKEMTTLAGMDCLEIPTASEVFRIVAGTEQMGRLHHEILAVVPRAAWESDPAPGNWWIKSWDESYFELALSDLTSPKDLREIAHDVGGQLGARNLISAVPVTEAQLRATETASLVRLEPRIRATARQLVAELLEGWDKFKASKAN